MAWRAFFRIGYGFLRLADRVIRGWWRGFGLGNVVALEIAGRRTGRRRSTLVGLLRAGDGWYVGHPDGPVDWTRNLEAAAAGRLSFDGRTWIPVVAVPLAPGDERERAIRATWQHPFPANVVYRLARGHVRRHGAYYRLEVIPAGEDPRL